MGNLWLKIKIWTKVTLILLILIHVVVFAVKNSEPQATVSFWYFFQTTLWSTSVLNLLLLAFLAGILTALLTRTALRTVSQFRELKHRQVTEQREKELESLKAQANLRTRPTMSPSADASRTEG